MRTFLDYAREISDGASNTALAKIAGVNKSTVGRWAEGLDPTTDAARRIAHHYGRPVVEAFIHGNLLAPGDIATREVRIPLSEYPHGALLRELERRLDARSSDPSGTISSPAQYGEEPTPDDYDLAAGTVARDHHTD